MNQGKVLGGEAACPQGLVGMHVNQGQIHGGFGASNATIQAQCSPTPRPTLESETDALTNCLKVLDGEIAMLETALETVSEQASSGSDTSQAEQSLPPALGEIRGARRWVEAMIARISSARGRLAL